MLSYPDYMNQMAERYAHNSIKEQHRYLSYLILTTNTIYENRVNKKYKYINFDTNFLWADIVTLDVMFYLILD